MISINRGHVMNVIWQSLAHRHQHTTCLDECTRYVTAHRLALIYTHHHSTFGSSPIFEINIVVTSKVYGLCRM